MNKEKLNNRMIKYVMIVLEDTLFLLTSKFDNIFFECNK